MCSISGIRVLISLSYLYVSDLRNSRSNFFLLSVCVRSLQFHLWNSISGIPVELALIFLSGVLIFLFYVYVPDLLNSRSIKTLTTLICQHIGFLQVIDIKICYWIKFWYSLY